VATSSNRGRRARLRLRTLGRWLWYFETTPVFPDETLLHSLPNNQRYFVADMGNWALSPTVFKPHPVRDLDGKSFFREDFTTPRKVAKANTHKDGVRVGRVTVRQLRELRMKAEPVPLSDELPGHAIVPDLRYVSPQTKEEKREAKKIQAKLAEIMTKNGIYTPRGLPDPVPTPPAQTPPDNSSTA